MTLLWNGGDERRTGAPRILLLALLPIGDTLLTVPTVEALRSRYPAARIVALARAGTASLLRCVRAVDEVVVLPAGPDWHGAGELVRMLRRLRAERFDAAIDFTSPAYKWVSLACGIPLRTYMKFDWLWWLVPAAHRRWRSTHATEHYYDCARELDLPPWSQVCHTPHLALPASARTDARAFLRARGVAPRQTCPADGASAMWGANGHLLVAMHAGGAWLGGLKRWPPRRFAALADRLCERWDAQVILLGGRGDAELCAAIASLMRHRPIVAAGAVPLLTSIGLLEACALFVGNDSGLLHAAAAVGTPYVGIFGPTTPANFGPVSSVSGQGTLVTPPQACRAPSYFVGGNPIWQRPCCRGTCRALATIDVQAVYDAADALLRQHGQTLKAGQWPAAKNGQSLAAEQRPALRSG